MKFPGIASQQSHHPLYTADGSAPATAGGVLVLQRSVSRSYLYLQNNGTNALWFEFGSARAHAVITNGVVTSVVVDNAGQGFSFPPRIQFDGGAANGLSGYTGLNQPEAMSPSARATAHCVMTGTAPNMSIASIVVDNGGSGYVSIPYVYIRNDDKDTNGVAIPSVGSGFQLTTGQSLIWNGATCPTDQISVIAATGATAFTARYMP